MIAIILIFLLIFSLGALFAWLVTSCHYKTRIQQREEKEELAELQLGKDRWVWRGKHKMTKEKMKLLYALMSAKKQKEDTKFGKTENSRVNKKQKLEDSPFFTGKRRGEEIKKKYVKKQRIELEKEVKCQSCGQTYDYIANSVGDNLHPFNCKKPEDECWIEVTKCVKKAYAKKQKPVTAKEAEKEMVKYFAKKQKGQK